MRVKFIAAMLISSLFLVACQSADVEVEGVTDDEEEAMVHLTAETDELPLRASFMSEHRSFVYTFDYDGYLLKLIDHHLDGASDYGPSFMIDGNAQLTGSTQLLDELEYVEKKAGAESLGDYEVYRYSGLEGDCQLEYAVVPFEEEGLILRMRACPDENYEMGMEALDQLLDNLMLEAFN